MYTCTYTICGVSLLRLQGCAIKLIKTRLALICVYKTLPKWEIKKIPICRKVAVKWIAYNDKVTPKIDEKCYAIDFKPQMLMELLTRPSDT